MANRYETVNQQRIEIPLLSKEGLGVVESAQKNTETPLLRRMCNQS